MTRRRARRSGIHSALVAVAAAGALLVVPVVAVAPAAPAAAETDTNWWFERYSVAAAHDAGTTGAGVKLAVIDARIDPDLSVFAGTSLRVHRAGLCEGSAATSEATPGSIHGSDVTALLVGNGTGPGSVRGIAPGADVTFYGYGVDAGGCTTEVDGATYSATGLGIRQAVADGNRIISISQISDARDDGDALAIADALARGVIIVAGQSNDLDDTRAFPGDATGVVAVNAFRIDGTLQTQGDGRTVSWPTTTVVAAGYYFSSQGTQNEDAWGDDGRRIRGSSSATPLVAGMLALTAQKFPEATGDQLLQSLIRNTGADDHELTRYEGGYGYGPASLTHLLRVDPTQYPDENPLLDEPGRSGSPTRAQIDAAREALTASSPSPSTAAAESAERTRSAVPIAVLMAVGAAVVLLAALIVILVVVARRRVTRRPLDRPGGTA
ncbi:S8 family serine peptidase [Schumannella sp. 10F1B-5-1]|uniref:S8 family serine peptidase n=1 Tax=Schumannella sp. 10F1B-5-1 TaxID=2590780 RepID=UPI0015E8364C|nr:S8 family serine peptidase [Schumannella sp. 10F1B-5-1]